MNKKNEEKPDRSKQRAIALGYDSSADQAPIIKAKGRGYVAEEIVNKAKEAGIPIQEDASLVAILSQLEMNEQIPENLYSVVAEVFRFIYKVDKDQQLIKKNK